MIETKFFRKRQDVIEAWQNNGDINQWPAWMAGCCLIDVTGLRVPTSLGLQEVPIGGWVAKTIEGCLVCYTDSIFKLSFEEIK